MKNIERIKTLYNTFKAQEKEWLKEVKMYVGELFSDPDYEITIYPVIGYDEGIGLNRNVCINLNSEICLRDYITRAKSPRTSVAG